MSEEDDYNVVQLEDNDIDVSVNHIMRQRKIILKSKTESNETLFNRALKFIKNGCD